MSTTGVTIAATAGEAGTPRYTRELRRFAAYAGALVIAGGVVVLIGWATDTVALQRLFTYGVTIKANTALGLVFAATAMLLRRDDARVSHAGPAALALAIGLTAIGVATLAEYVFAVDLGIDQLLFRAVRDVGRTPTPGRMAAVTAAAFVMLGVGLATLDLETPRRHRPALVLILATIALGLMSVLGYVYGAIPTVGLGQGIQIALPTAIALILIGSATLVLRPNAGWMRFLLSPHAGGPLARRMLPFAFGVPLLLGGVRAFLTYTTPLSPATLSAIFAVITMLVFGALIMHTSAVLDAADRERDAANAARAEVTARAEALGLLDVVLSSAPVAFALFDPGARVIRVNQALAALAATTPDCCEHRSLAEVVPEIAEPVEQAVKTVVATGAPLMDLPLTVPVTHSKRKQRHFIGSYYPVARATGELVGVGVFLLETTDRRSLEAQLLQSQKMEAVGRLAGGVAHDFNNLLTVIGSYAGLLNKSLPEGDPRQSEVAEIRDATLRAAQLTRQLLTFSRSQVVEPRVVSPNEVVRSTESMLKRIIGADVALDTKLAPDADNVLVDVGQLEQVVMNLVVNARDAMPEGGRITLETANVELSEDYGRDHVGVTPGPYVMIAVTDTGTGMTNDVLEHLFEPFFTTKAVGVGTGLGLSTVYGIVKQSGGDVWVYSEVGHGSTFKVYLPRHTGASRYTPISTPVIRPAGGHETILVVEDEDRVRQLAVRVLRGSGYTVLEARDGPSALRLAGAHDGPVHLVLSDVVIPGASGRVVVESLLDARPSARALFMSGYTDDDVMRRGIVSRTTAFLQKPFTADQLLAKVRQVLDA